MSDALGMMIMRGTLNEVSSESDEVKEAMARLLLEQAGVGGKLPGDNDTVISAVGPSYQAMRLGGERPMSERAMASDEIVNQALAVLTLTLTLTNKTLKNSTRHTRPLSVAFGSDFSNQLFEEVLGTCNQTNIYSMDWRIFVT